MAKKRVNKKLLLTLSAIGLAFVVVGVIFYVQYKFQDPLPHLERGIGLIDEATAAEEEINLAVAQIEDPCQAFLKREELREERTEDLWKEARKALDSAFRYSRKDQEMKIRSLEEMARMFKLQKSYSLLRGTWAKMYQLDTNNYEAKYLESCFERDRARNYPRQFWHLRWPELEPYAELLIEIDPQDKRGYLLQAEILVSLLEVGTTQDYSKDYEKTVEILDTVLGMDENDALAYRLYGRLTMLEASRVDVGELGGTERQNQLYQQAKAYFEQGIARNPDDPDAYEALLNDYYLSLIGQKEAALRETRKALMDANNGIITEEHVAMLQSMQAVILEYRKEMEAEIEETITQFPQAGRFPMIMARLLIQRDRRLETLDRAIDYNVQGVSCLDAEPGWYYQLAELYRQRSDYLEEPAEQLSQAFQLLRELLYFPELNTEDPGPKGPFYNQTRARSLQLLIEIGAACQDTQLGNDVKQRYLDITKDFAREFRETRGADDWFVRVSDGTIALVEGERDEAIRLFYNAYAELQGSNKQDPMVSWKLFQALKETSYHELSLRYAREAIVLGKNSPRVFIDYIEALVFNPNLGLSQLALEVAGSYTNNYGEEAAFSDKLDRLKAKAYLQLGDREQARALLAELPDSPEVALLKAQAMETEQQRAQALLEIAEDDLSNFNVISSLYQYYLNQGAEDPGYYDQAKALLDKALSVEQDNEFVLKQMRARLDEPDPNAITSERDREIVFELINELPDGYDKQQRLGNYYMTEARSLEPGSDEALGQWELAAQHFRAAYQQKKDDLNMLRQYFNVLLTLEDWPAAVGLVAQVGSFDDVAKLEFEADLYVAQENWDEAARTLDEYLKVRPVSVQAHVTYAKVLNALGKLTQAIEQARIGLSQSPRHVGANQLLALLLHERYQNYAPTDFNSESQLSEIIQAVDTAINQGGANDQMLNLRLIYYPILADYYARQYREPALSRELKAALRGRIEQLYSSSIDLCQRIISVMPTNEALWNQLASLYERYGEALQDESISAQVDGVYQRAIEANPSSVGLKTAYSSYLRREGRVDEAEEMLAGMVQEAEGDDVVMAKVNRARIYIQEGLYDQALSSLQEALQEDDQNPVVLRELAELYVLIGQPIQGAEHYLKLREIADSELVTVRCIEVLLQAGQVEKAQEVLEDMRNKYDSPLYERLLAGKVELRRGDYDKAIQFADMALEQDENNVMAYLIKSESLFYQEKLDDALVTIRELRTKEGESNNVGRSLLSQIYWRMGRYSEAIRELEQLLLNDPDDLDARRRLARMMQLAQRWNDLDRFYETTIERYPKAIAWYLEAADIYLSRMSRHIALNEQAIAANDMSRAQEEFAAATRLGNRALELVTQALEVSKETGEGALESRSMMLQTLKALGRYDEVISRADSFMQNQPGDAVMMMWKSEALYRLDRKTEALDVFEKALEKAEELPQLSDMILRNVVRVGEPDEIQSWCERKLADNPDWLAMRLVLAGIYRERGMVAQEIAQLLEAYQRAEGTQKTQIDMMLAVAYSRDGQNDEAIRRYRQLLKDNPDNYNFLNNLAYLLLNEPGQQEEAVKLAEKAYHLASNQPYIMDTYAAALLAQEDYENAESIMTRAIQELQREAQPIPIDFYLHHAEALVGLERTDEARDVLVKASEVLREMPRNALAEQSEAKIRELRDKL